MCIRDSGVCTDLFKRAGFHVRCESRNKCLLALIAVFHSILATVICINTYRAENNSNSLTSKPQSFQLQRRKEREREREGKREGDGERERDSLDCPPVLPLADFSLHFTCDYLHKKTKNEKVTK